MYRSSSAHRTESGLLCNYKANGLGLRACPDWCPRHFGWNNALKPEDNGDAGPTVAATSSSIKKLVFTEPETDLKLLPQAFTRTVQQEPDNGDAWANIAAVHLQKSCWAPAFAAAAEVTQ